MERIIFFILYILIISCGPPAPTQNNNSHVDSVLVVPTGGSELLYMNKWFFTELNGKDVTIPQNGEIPHLLLYPGQVSRVNGYTGCNTFNGVFNLDTGNVISFSKLATTRKMCPDMGTQEQDLQLTLEQATHYTATGTTLLLIKKGIVTARLISASQDGVSHKTPIRDEQYHFWNDKLLGGTDFSATGNEPFWHLEIDLKKMIRFVLIDGDSVSAPIPSPEKSEDGSVMIYRSATDKGILEVRIYDKSCINDMSGHTVEKNG